MMSTSLKLVTAPTSPEYPVTSDEAKLHARIDNNDEDALIDVLISAATEYVETGLNRQLLNATLRYSISSWDKAIPMPRPPLSSVTSVTYYDADGVLQTVDSSEYNVETDSEPGYLVFTEDFDYPSTDPDRMFPILITFVAGYGAAATSVPKRARQAILCVVADMYLNRETQLDVGKLSLNVTIQRLLQSLRWRI